MNSHRPDTAIPLSVNAGAGAGGGTVRRRRRDRTDALGKLREQRRLQETAQASWDVWTAVTESGKPKRRARWGRRIAVVTVVAAGTFVALNADARQTVLGLLPNGDANASHSPQ